MRGSGLRRKVRASVLMSLFKRWVKLGPVKELGIVGAKGWFCGRRYGLISALAQ
jgi:hypothetical protein